MSSRTLMMTDRLHAFLVAEGLRDDELLKSMRAETERMEFGGMQISPEQGQFMAFLVETMGAARCLEIGTFTGYSALCVARALPPGGRLVCLDKSAEWTGTARRHWQKAGVEAKIELRLGPAREALDRMIEDGEAGRYDFAFIDADKTGYDFYFERCLKLVRVGGVVALDNMLWQGRVADPAADDEDTVAIRDMIGKLRADHRVAMCLLPVGDGLALCRRRS